MPYCFEGSCNPTKGNNEQLFIRLLKCLGASSHSHAVFMFPFIIHLLKKKAEKEEQPKNKILFKLHMKMSGSSNKLSQCQKAMYTSKNIIVLHRFFPWSPFPPFPFSSFWNVMLVCNFLNLGDNQQQNSYHNLNT